MALYRKKPVVIEATQYTGQHIEGICTGECVSWPDCAPHIHTLEGVHTVSDGDWVITGVKNENYPCKPDIFALTYDPELVPSGG